MDVDSSRLNVAMKIGEKFTPEKFRYMCIVAGCDYLASLPGIGIGKARKLFQLTANPDITQVKNIPPLHDNRNSATLKKMHMQNHSQETLNWLFE